MAKRYTCPAYKGTVGLSEFRSLSKIQKLEVMRTWFYENFEDPAEHTPWIDGEFVYLHGGPYYAEEELNAEFGGKVPEKFIVELAEELNCECDVWTRHPAYEADIDDYPWSKPDAFAAFERTIDATKSLLQVAVPQGNSQHFLRLQYASVITALETYLSDFFIAIVSSNQAFFRKFVQNNKDFSERKFQLNEIFNRLAHIEKDAVEYLRGIMWHDLAKAEKIYLATLNISFPVKEELCKAVSIRHDIIHRGGKTKDGREHEINPVQVENLIAQATTLVSHLQKEWKIIQDADANEFFGLTDSDNYST